MSQHTPGPWEARHKPGWTRGQVYSGDGERVCCVGELEHGEAPGIDPARVGANARLIAAAPDLLDVCRRVLEYNYSIDKDGTDRDGRNVVIALEAAIAKATTPNQETA